MLLILISVIRLSSVAHVLSKARPRNRDAGQKELPRKFERVRLGVSDSSVFSQVHHDMFVTMILDFDIEVSSDFMLRISLNQSGIGFELYFFGMA